MFTTNYNIASRGRINICRFKKLLLFTEGFKIYSCLSMKVVFNTSALANCCRAKEENHKRQKTKMEIMLIYTKYATSPQLWHWSRGWKSGLTNYSDTCQNFGSPPIGQVPNQTTFDLKLITTVIRYYPLQFAGNLEHFIPAPTDSSNKK